MAGRLGVGGRLASAVGWWWSVGERTAVAGRRRAGEQFGEHLALGFLHLAGGIGGRAICWVQGLQAVPEVRAAVDHDSGQPVEGDQLLDRCGPGFLGIPSGAEGVAPQEQLQQHRSIAEAVHRQGASASSLQGDSPSP